VKELSGSLSDRPALPARGPDPGGFESQQPNDDRTTQQSEIAQPPPEKDEAANGEDEKSAKRNEPKPNRP
jgi:hypothetical protein